MSDSTNTYRKLFSKTLLDAEHILEAKIRDYEDAEHPLRTFRLSADLHIEPWRGCLLRLGDKLSLLYSFTRNGGYTSHNEDVTETLLDVIVYAGLTKVLYELRAELPPLSVDDLVDRMRARAVLSPDTHAHTVTRTPTGGNESE
jgi:hypothetical protein